MTMKRKSASASSDDSAVKAYRAALVTAKKAQASERNRYELDEVEHETVEVIG